MKHSKGILLFVLISFSIIGCASYQPAVAPSLNYDLTSQQNKVEKEGLVLLIKPVYMTSELEAFFDDDLVRNYGILPVHFNLSNKSYPGTLVFSTDSFNLLSPARERAPILSSNDVYKKAKKSHWRTVGWTVAFGVFGLIPSIINVENTNKKIQADLDTKVVKSGNLTVGSQTEGFAFFSIPQTISSLSGWQLSLLLKDLANGKEVQIDYGLEGTIIPAKPPQEAEDADKPKGDVK